MMLYMLFPLKSQSNYINVEQKVSEQRCAQGRGLRNLRKTCQWFDHKIISIIYHSIEMVGN